MSLHLPLLVEISETVTHASDLDEALGPVLRTLARAGFSQSALRIVDGSDLPIEAAHGLTPAEIRRDRGKVGQDVPGRVAQMGVAAIEDHLLCVPVTWRGEVIGTLSAIPQHAARADDATLLRATAAMLAALVRGRPRSSREPAPTGFRPPGLIGRSKAMHAVYELLAQVAPTDTTVLLRGESGTGKELIASALQALGPRANRPFIRVNCAALPETLIESELFGHERGAFTGAHQQRRGRFELAHTGTLFLDEIGDLTPMTQVKLLRVLQERSFERVGGSQTIHADVRVIAATSRDLEAMMAEGRFREDLYYRLNVFPVRLPPLRERRTDITLLADHFVEVCNRAHGKSVQRISTSAIDMLLAYHWPGNVRELENCIERAVLVARGGVLHGHHLPPTLQTAEASGTTAQGGLEHQLNEVERELLLDALKSARGNMARAARELEVTERVMGLRVHKHGIDPRRFKRTA